MQKVGAPYFRAKGHHLHVLWGFWRTLTGRVVVVPFFSAPEIINNFLRGEMKMTKKSILVLLIVILVVMSGGQEVMADFPICTEPSAQKGPAIDGNIVVWQNRSVYYDIYGYDLDTATEFPICTNANGQYTPAIDGNIVVWQDDRNGNEDIYGYNLDTATEFSICTDTNNQYWPAIDGNIVVWRDYRNGNWDIYGYNLDTTTEFPICTVPGIQDNPAIDNNIVVWTDYRNGNGDIYGYNLDTATEFPICTVPGTQDHPAIDNNIVVWQDYLPPGGDEDIYGYNLDTATEFPICMEPSRQYRPAIYGNIVVWTDHRSGNRDIYGYDLDTATEFPICTDTDEQYTPDIDGNIVVWIDDRNGNEDIYGCHYYDTCGAVKVLERVPRYGSTLGATGVDESSCGYNDTFDVWHYYQPQNGGSVTVSTDGSTFDTTLSVFNACGGEELACNDDYSLNNTQSKVSFDAVKGKTYHIRIAGFNGERGSYELLITRGECIAPLTMDADGDCKVDFVDFVVFASEWLHCGLDDQNACWE